jgi:hypothetical protein
MLTVYLPTRRCVDNTRQRESVIFTTMRKLEKKMISINADVTRRSKEFLLRRTYRQKT